MYTSIQGQAVPVNPVKWSLLEVGVNRSHLPNGLEDQRMASPGGLSDFAATSPQEGKGLVGGPVRARHPTYY